MSISINTNINHWMPKEVSTAAIGITVTAACNLAIQFLLTSSTRPLPGIALHFVGYSCGAAAIAGTVMTIYSTVRLCEKMITEKTALHKAVTATTLGCLPTALAQTIGQHFWTIAPSFDHLYRHSMAYCISTNLAWQIAAITGLAGVVFTAYAAYRTGQVIFATINPATIPS